MRSLVLVALATTALSGGCGKTDSSSDWTDFHGMQFRAPPGTQSNEKDGVLPGPGGQGGIPSGVRISLTLSRPNPNGFYVEIVKSAEPTSLEGEKYVLLGNKIGSNLVGKVTPTGWELTYDMPVTNDLRAASQTHVVYADLAGGHFQCTYADINCADRAAAESICRSMRAKPTK